ncbi:MAG: CBS domain-containing protein [Candidatus Woesearchaeota archaeon]
MLDELKQIKKIRNRLGINQKELAVKAGVSQSLIAKIESGKIEPTYSKVKRIFEALNELEEKEELKAKDLMNRRVIFIKPNDIIKKVIRLMKEKGISQLPVLDQKKISGMVNEKIILENISEGKNIAELKVKEVMDDSPPIISLETSQKIILELLKENSIVLVAEKGEVRGLISKSDILEKF